VDAHAGVEADHLGPLFPARNVSIRGGERDLPLVGMTTRGPHSNSIRNCLSVRWVISISTKVTSATCHGLGMVLLDFRPDWGDPADEGRIQRRRHLLRLLKRND
jgi:hypothetical protein